MKVQRDLFSYGGFPGYPWRGVGLAVYWEPVTNREYKLTMPTLKIRTSSVSSDDRVPKLLTLHSRRGQLSTARQSAAFAAQSA